MGKCRQKIEKNEYCTVNCDTWKVAKKCFSGAWKQFLKLFSSWQFLYYRIEHTGIGYACQKGFWSPSLDKAWKTKHSTQKRNCFKIKNW